DKLASAEPSRKATAAAERAALARAHPNPLFAFAADARVEVTGFDARFALAARPARRARRREHVSRTAPSPTAALRARRCATRTMGARGLDLLREPQLRRDRRLGGRAVHESRAHPALRPGDELPGPDAPERAELHRGDV